ncbi:UNVERIFIED_ORG: hypothetical protein ABRZ91_000934 [Heyndrickxia coagulans]
MKTVVKFCLTLVLAYFINQLISRIFAYYLPEEGAGAIFVPILIFSFDLLAGYAIVGYIFKVAAKKSPGTVIRHPGQGHSDLQSFSAIPDCRCRA